MFIPEPVTSKGKKNAWSPERDQVHPKLALGLLFPEHVGRAGHHLQCPLPSVTGRISWILTVLNLSFPVHQNYIGNDAEKSPFFLSVTLSDQNNQRVPQYRAILWRKTGTQKICLPYSPTKTLSVKSILRWVLMGRKPMHGFGAVYTLFFPVIILMLTFHCLEPWLCETFC